jgi:hypothetical protein
MAASCYAQMCFNVLASLEVVKGNKYCVSRASKGHFRHMFSDNVWPTEAPGCPCYVTHVILSSSPTDADAAELHISEVL